MLLQATSMREANRELVNSFHRKRSLLGSFIEGAGSEAD